jgi:hypothetical protein
MSPLSSLKMTIAPAAARLLVYEVGCDDALRLQTDAVAIEDERAFEVVDGEGDDIETRLHRSAFSFAGSTMRTHATAARSFSSPTGFRQSH